MEENGENCWRHHWLHCTNLLSHLQMNYMFLKQQVESRPSAPMQQQWLESIVSRVPGRLKESPATRGLLQELCTEVGSDFHRVIVQHTGMVSYITVSFGNVKVSLKFNFLPLVDTVLRNPEREAHVSESHRAAQPK